MRCRVLLWSFAPRLLLSCRPRCTSVAAAGAATVRRGRKNVSPPPIPVLYPGSGGPERRASLELLVAVVEVGRSLGGAVAAADTGALPLGGCAMAHGSQPSGASRPHRYTGVARQGRPRDPGAIVQPSSPQDERETARIVANTLSRQRTRLCEPSLRDMNGEIDLP